MQDSHHLNLGLPPLTTSLGGAPLSHPGPNLGNFHFEQPRFDIPGMPPPLTVQTPAFTMPELGSSAGFAHPTLSGAPTAGYSPGFFKPPSLHLSSEEKATLGLGTKLFEKVGALEIPQPLKTLGLVADAAKKGKQISDGMGHDEANGKSLPRAGLCNALGVLAEAASGVALKGVVATEVFAGLTTSAGLMAAGVASANPPLAAAGLTAGVGIAAMGPKAYGAAGDAAKAFGELTKNACYGNPFKGPGQ